MKLEFLFVGEDQQSLNQYLFAVLNEQDLFYHFLLPDKREMQSYCENTKLDCVFISLSAPVSSYIEYGNIVLQYSPEAKLVFLLDDPNDKNALESKFPNKTITIEAKENLNIAMEKAMSFFRGNEEKEIRFVTFGPFDCFVSGKRVQFPSKKSKELLALMVAYPNSTLELEYTISQLWPDYNAALAKRLYRDAVCKLRKTLIQEGISEICQFFRGATSLLPKNATCDYWSYLASNSKEGYWGEFLSSYEWSFPIQLKLDEIKSSR